MTGREFSRAAGGFALLAALVSLPSAFAGFPQVLDTAATDLAAAHVRAASESLEHSHRYFLGFPFAAYPPHMAFYPPVRLADRLLPPRLAFPVLEFLHMIVAGLGVFALARIALRAKPPAAFLAGAVFLASGFFAARRGQLHILSTSAWMTWALAGAAWALLRGRRWGHLVSAGALALGLLAGHFHFVLMGVVLLWISAPFFSRRPAALAAAGLGVPLLGAALAAMIVLPAGSLLRESTRESLIAAEFLDYSLHPADLLQLLVPGAFGGHLGPLFTRRYAGFTNFHDTACYLGLVPLALAIGFLAARARRSWRARWLAAVAALGLLLALGRYNPLYALLRDVPGINLFRAPARWLFPVDLALALGFGLAFDRWLLRRRLHREAARPVRAVCAVTAAAVLVLVLFWAIGRAKGWREEITWEQPRPAAVVARNLAVASHPFTPRLLIPLALAAAGWIVARRGPRALGALAVADVALFACSISVPPPSAIPPDRDLARRVREDALRRGWDPGAARVLTDGDPSEYLMQGLAVVAAGGSMFPTALADRVRIGRQGPLEAWPTAEEMARLGIAYAVSRGRLPPPAPSPLLEAVGPGGVHALPSALPLVRPSTSSRWTPGRIEAELPASDGRIEVACLWDEGWRARADGAEVPIERSVPFMRVIAPPYSRRLVLEYAGPAFRLGRIVSGAAALVALSLLIYWSGTWK